MTPIANEPRIAYLLKKFPRLSETFVLNEILAQEATGRDLHVFARRERDEEPLHPQMAHLRAAVETLPSRREIDPWETLFGGEADTRALLDRLAELVPKARAWQHPKFSSLLVEALHLLRRTADLGIQHVHTHFATDSAFVAMLLQEIGGPTYSLTAHAKDIYRSTVDPALLGRIVERSAFTVTVCDANVNFMAERLPPEAIAKLRRLYNGVDLAAFQPDARAPEERHILSVGRLVEKKGFYVLLDALRILADQGEAFRASIIGDGLERESLQLRIEALGLGDRVQLLGALDQGEVRDHMQRAAVFCLPCLVGEDGNRDALPTVLLEALASGLPVISTPVTGIPEILAAGRAGVLVPEHDSAATAAALRALLGDRGKRKELAREGRAHVEATFDAVQIAATLGSWFDAVLQSTEAGCESLA